jgi:hypothetical protein
LEHGTVTESSINRQGTVKTLRRASLDVETPKAKTPNDLKNKSSKTWDAYSNAYFDRYKCEPIRNAKVSGQLCQLVDRVGAEDAPYLAAFYLTHNNSFYAGKRHSVDALLRDCEGLMTDMRTGHRTTQAQAIQADKTQTNVNVFQKLMQENRNKQTAGV